VRVDRPKAALLGMTVSNDTHRRYRRPTARSFARARQEIPHRRQAAEKFATRIESVNDVAISTPGPVLGEPASLDAEPTTDHAPGTSGGSTVNMNWTQHPQSRRC
jgi:hypothetical protein